MLINTKLILYGIFVPYLLLVLLLLDRESEYILLSGTLFLDTRSVVNDTMPWKHKPEFISNVFAYSFVLLKLASAGIIIIIH